MKTANHPSGGPCWAELSTPDVAAAHAFYGNVLSWDSAPSGSPGDQYATLTLHGELIGAMTLADGGSAPRWDLYFTSEDLASTSKAVEAAGGCIASAAMQVLDRGSVAMYRAPDGAEFGAWQPGDRVGFGVMREPGAPSWFELNTPDTERATSFYTEVFGWTPTLHAFGDFNYTDVKARDGAMDFGGITPRSAAWPDVVPVQWTPYFAVRDADATAARALELHGSVVSAPKTLDGIGRVATFLDPHGAAFSVISYPEWNPSAI
jgi:predicted enzyme related to lactoylglutathione lyase